MAVKKKKADPRAQHLRFKEMARELGADESPSAFDRTLKRIVPGKPAPVPAKKPARAK